MSDLNLFDGAKVKLRNGETGVIKRHADHAYPWRGVSAGITWTQSGKHFDGSIDSLDIVEVLNPEDCPDSASQPEAAPVTCGDPINPAAACYVLHWRHDHERISGVIPRILSQSEVDLIEMVLEAVVPVRDVEIVKVDRG